MPYSSSEPPIDKTETLKKHLSTQLQGIIIKFLKDLDEITDCEDNIDLSPVLRAVTEQINSAYALYSKSHYSDLRNQTQLFHQQCQLIISQCQKQLTGMPDRSPQIKSTTSRFFNEVSALINYALHGTAHYQKPNETSASIPVELIGSLKEKFFSTKKQQTSETISIDAKISQDKDATNGL